MSLRRGSSILLAFLALLWCVRAQPEAEPSRARNVILFIGDGMGVSTVTAARIFAAGVGGSLSLDRLPYTALSRTHTADHVTPDSAGTMVAMMTGVKTNSGLLGLDPATERADFNGDGDGRVLPTVFEKAKGAGMRVGVVSTARVTHATPAACYAHINDRDREDEIALQALPGDPSYNAALGSGIDLILGGGRRHFVPAGITDEEGEPGGRRDGRDLRAEFGERGYTYVWNTRGFERLKVSNLPVLGLFERSHMEYEHDRPHDAGGEPSLAALTGRAIELLAEASRGEGERGYLLVVEGGRIDHAHHANNAYRAITDTIAFDLAVAAALERVDLQETLVIATADHSHVFNIAGYPLRPLAELPYAPRVVPEGYRRSPGPLLDIVYDVNREGVVAPSLSGGNPYVALGYLNGPGHLSPRPDPRTPLRPDGTSRPGPADPEARQFAGMAMGADTHAGEDVVIYATGPGAQRVHGTVQNTFVHDLIRDALGLDRSR